MLFIVLVIILSFISLFHAFKFALIVDDWIQLWGALFDRSILIRYFSDHPSVALEFMFLSKIFGFNQFYYYLLSFFLKVVCSFFVALMLYGLTKSKKASIYSGLIFASSVMGLEAFDRISAHYAAFSIILLSLGLFFWICASEKKFIRNTLIAITSFFFALLGDPGSTAMIIPLIIMWEFFTVYQQSFRKEILRKASLRFLLICGISISVFSIVSQLAKFFSSDLYSSQLQYAITHFGGSLNNYLNSIGHLLVGWFIPIDETLGLSSSTAIGVVAGYLLLIVFIMHLILFFKTKKSFYKITSFLLGWILFFYFPSWITQGHIVIGGLVIGVTNRYLALSSVALICFFGIILMKIKNKGLSTFFLLTIISLNLFTANKLLSVERQYRSQETQEWLYNKIDVDVPKGSEKDSIFVFLGNNPLKIFGLEWNGVYPFTLKRGIYNRADFPLVMSDIKSIVSKLCTDKDNYSLSKTYAWDVSSGDIINVSEQFREVILQNATCNLEI